MDFSALFNIINDTNDQKRKIENNDELNKRRAYTENSINRLDKDAVAKRTNARLNGDKLEQNNACVRHQALEVPSTHTAGAAPERLRLRLLRLRLRGLRRLRAARGRLAPDAHQVVVRDGHQVARVGTERDVVDDRRVGAQDAATRGRLRRRATGCRLVANRTLWPLEDLQNNTVTSRLLYNQLPRLPDILYSYS